MLFPAPSYSPNIVSFKFGDGEIKVGGAAEIKRPVGQHRKNGQVGRESK